ncbi:MAG: Protease HtpX [Candidatus Peribacteria bacterium]|nr:Protease HtpX [Candidatus Peribacteria bacterium]
MNNTLKTTLFLGALTALLLAVGYVLGGQNGMLIALVLSAVMNFGSYWFSDKIILSLYRAKEIGPDDAPRLYAMVTDLAEKEGIPMPRIYMVDLPVPNAFATGRNERHAAVAVSKSILDLLDEDELRGVLAHELSHVRNRDVLISSIAATLAGALSYIAQIAYFTGGMTGSSRNNNDRGSNAIGSLLILILAPFIATLLHLAVSRSREYLADETGAKISQDPHALASALQKLDAYAKTHPVVASPRYEATSHLFIINPFKQSLLLSLFSTHPSTEERVRRLEEMSLNMSRSPV